MKIFWVNFRSIFAGGGECAPCMIYPKNLLRQSLPFLVILKTLEKTLLIKHKNSIAKLSLFFRGVWIRRGWIGVFGAPLFSVQRSQNTSFKGFWDLWAENRGAPKTPNPTMTDPTLHSRPCDFEVALCLARLFLPNRHQRCLGYMHLRLIRFSPAVSGIFSHSGMSTMST